MAIFWCANNDRGGIVGVFLPKKSAKQVTFHILKAFGYIMLGT